MEKATSASPSTIRRKATQKATSCTSSAAVTDITASSKATAGMTEDYLSQALTPRSAQADAQFRKSIEPPAKYNLAQTIVTVEIKDDGQSAPKTDTFALKIWDPTSGDIWRQIRTSILGGRNVVVHSK
jgi:hypothetical protein